MNHMHLFLLYLPIKKIYINKMASIILNALKKEKEKRVASTTKIVVGGSVGQKNLSIL